MTERIFARYQEEERIHFVWVPCGLQSAEWIGAAPERIRIERESGAAAEMSSCISQAPACFQDVGGFCKRCDTAVCEVLLKDMREVVQIDDRFEAQWRSERESMINQRFASDFDHRFWLVRCERAHTSAETCGKDHQSVWSVPHLAFNSVRSASEGAGKSARSCVRMSDSKGCSRSRIR